MLIGVTKTGLPGIGILSVPLVVYAFPDHTHISIGIGLGIRILADLFSASYYRRHANFKHIFRLIPITLLGILAGYYILKVVNGSQLKRIIGVIVLTMLTIDYIRSRTDKEKILTTSLWFVIMIGIFAGIATMMANAAGPIMAIYLLAMRLPKTEFVATSAWFFFIINWIKVPFSASLDMMTPETVKVCLILLPFIALGAITGIFVLKKIPLKAFRVIVRSFAVLAAVKLLF